MKALISFSLMRRLNNPVSWMLYGFSFLLFGVLMFSDVLLTSLAPSLVLPRSIHMNSEMFDRIGEYLPSNFVFQSDPLLADIKIQVSMDEYKVVGHLNAVEQQWVDQMIHGYHRLSMVEKMPDSMVSIIDDVMMANIVWDNEADEPSDHAGFIVITSIYFMLLSFSTAVANEVVNEKTSNVIEIILTSVSHKEHYYSKLLIGWFTMLSQMMIHSCGFIFWFMVRVVFDDGKGIMGMMYRWQWLSVRFI